MLTYGRPMLAGVALAATIVELATLRLVGDAPTLAPASALAVAGGIGFGAALQAGFAAALIRRFDRQPPPLPMPAAVARARSPMGDDR